jgi:hypothetical protein
MDAATQTDTSSSDAEDEGSVTDATVAGAELADTAPTTDGEGGCACSHIDSGLPPFPLNGVVPMSCYCDMPWSGFG